MAYVGLALGVLAPEVGPWVRVDPGGGSPRPWEKQGLRLGLGVLALAPGVVMGGGVPCAQGGFGYCNVSSWVRVVGGLPQALKE